MIELAHEFDDSSREYEYALVGKHFIVYLSWLSLLNDINSHLKSYS